MPCGVPHTYGPDQHEKQTEGCTKGPHAVEEKKRCPDPEIQGHSGANQGGNF